MADHLQESISLLVRDLETFANGLKGMRNQLRRARLSLPPSGKRQSNPLIILQKERINASNEDDHLLRQLKKHRSGHIDSNEQSGEQQVRLSPDISDLNTVKKEPQDCDLSAEL